MARNLTSSEAPIVDQVTPDPAPAHEPPKEGGSYRRDKQTSELTLVEQTKPAAPAEKE